MSATTMLVYGFGHPFPLPGKKVPGSEARYLPFGGYRSDLASREITDCGFTDHKHNDGLGLITMRARYVVPGARRLAPYSSSQLGGPGTCGSSEGAGPSGG